MYSFGFNENEDFARSSMLALAKDDVDEFVACVKRNTDALLSKNAFQIDLGSFIVHSLFELGYYLNSIKCVDMLEKNGLFRRSDSCIYGTAAGGSIELFKSLRLTSEQLANHGNKIVNIATKFGNLDILKFVFPKVDLDLIQDTSTHPMYYASKYNQTKCLEFLFDSLPTDQITTKVLDVIAKATTELKAEDSLNMLYNMFKDGEKRKVILKYIIPCDALYLFTKEYDTTTFERGYSDKIIKNGSIRIFKYLIDKGIPIPHSTIVGRSGVTKEIQAIYVKSDPEYYIKAAISNGRDREKNILAVMALEYIDNIDPTLAYRAVGNIQNYDIYRVLLKKMPNEQEFNDNLILYLLGCGKIDQILDLGLLRRYSKNPLDLFAHAMNESVQTFLVTHRIITPSMVDANFCAQFLQDEKKFAPLLLSELDCKKLLIDLMEMHQYPLGFLGYICSWKKKLRHDKDINEILRREDQNPPKEFLREFRPGWCPAVKKYFMSPEKDIMEDLFSTTEIYRKLNPEEKKEARNCLSKKNAIFMLKIERFDKDWIEPQSSDG